LPYQPRLHVLSLVRLACSLLSRDDPTCGTLCTARRAVHRRLPICASSAVYIPPLNLPCSTVKRQRVRRRRGEDRRVESRDVNQCRGVERLPYVVRRGSRACRSRRSEDFAMTKRRWRTCLRPTPSEIHAPFDRPLPLALSVAAQRRQPTQPRFPASLSPTPPLSPPHHLTHPSWSTSPRMSSVSVACAAIRTSVRLHLRRAAC
jgi:hypothetical protein